MAGIEWSTSRHGKHQCRRRPDHPLLLVLPLLPLLMQAEGDERTGSQVDGTARALSLDWDLDQPLPVLPLDRLFDLHGPRIQIDLLPGQPGCLPDPQPGGNEEYPEGMEPVLPGHLEELGDLTGRQRIGLMA